MLISEKTVAALNTQIGNEFGAFIQYVQIASHFGNENLPELSKHFYRQADEERTHALKFVNYLVDAGGRVAIPAIPAPKHKFANAEEAVKLSLDWEITVTKQINGLMDPPVVRRRAARGGFEHGHAPEHGPAGGGAGVARHRGVPGPPQGDARSDAGRRRGLALRAHIAAAGTTRAGGMIHGNGNESGLP